MKETQPAPVSQIVIEFGGSDGLAPTIRSTNLSAAQWAEAAALVNLTSQSIWAQVVAQAQAQGIVRAAPSALAGLSLAARLSRAGRGRE